MSPRLQLIIEVNERQNTKRIIIFSSQQQLTIWVDLKTSRDVPHLGLSSRPTAGLAPRLDWWHNARLHWENSTQTRNDVTSDLSTWYCVILWVNGNCNKCKYERYNKEYRTQSDSCTLSVSADSCYLCADEVLIVCKVHMF